MGSFEQAIYASGYIVIADVHWNSLLHISAVMLCACI